MLILFVAVVGALIPTIVYVAAVWWLDRYEKEPVGLLAAAFFWGAIPAAILSVVLELIFDLPLSALGGQGLAANLFSASINAPLVEETCKGIGLLILLLLFRREFDDVLDGIVYGAMIGFGFALAENLGAYFLPILSEQGIGAGIATIFLRSFVFGLNHAFWTACTGAAVGYARLHRGWMQRTLVPVGGWTLAVLFHALHNAGATLAEQTACLSLGLSLVVDWGGVLMLLVIVSLVLRKERRWIEQELAEEVGKGALHPQEFELLRSSWLRQWRRWDARRRGGADAYRTVGRYYQCATELAFKKQQLRSLGSQDAAPAEIQQLQQRLGVLRGQAAPWLWPVASNRP